MTDDKGKQAQTVITLIKRAKLGQTQANRSTLGQTETLRMKQSDAELQK